MHPNQSRTLAARQTSASATANLADAAALMAPTEGHTATGRLPLTTEGDGVRVMGTLTALTPNGRYGINIHEYGVCGAPGRDTHIGDLGNVPANCAGVVYLDIWIPGATVHSVAATDISDTAVIVHAHADDLSSNSAVPKLGITRYVRRNQAGQVIVFEVVSITVKSVE